MRFIILYSALFPFIFTSCAKAEPVELGVLNEITTIMSEHYYDTTYSGLEWDKMVQETKAKIIDSSNSVERYKHISTLLKSLKHSHLEFVPPGETKEEGPKIPVGSPRQINFELEKVNGLWTVTRLVEQSDAERAGLKLGMVVEKINKWKTAELYKNDKTMAFYRMRQMLLNFPKRKIELTVQGQKKPVSWELSPYEGTFEQLGFISDAAQVEKKILPGNIGYIRFSIFLVNPAKETIQAIKEFRDKGCPGIIIDVRNNPGGVAMMAPAIAKEFCTKNYNMGTQKGRDMTLKFPVFAQPKPYTGKVVILTNKTSASTSEIFAAGTQAVKYAYVIGETTAGMALPSVMVTLKDGSIFQYPVADFKTVDGKNIEGVGAVPDLKVSHTHEQLSKGKDIFIEEAISYINSQK